MAQHTRRNFLQKTGQLSVLSLFSASAFHTQSAHAQVLGDTAKIMVGFS